MVKNERKAVWHLFFWSLLLFGGLTAINAVIMVNSIGPNILQPIQRNIASVTTPKTLLPKPDNAPRIEIDCTQSKTQHSQRTTALSFRIQLENCTNVAEVINESNHNEGHLFEMSKNQWTTDFISLDKGLNKIKINLGKSTQVIEITRKELKKPSSSL